jgi:Family of unknown function (DUF5343)
MNGTEEKRPYAANANVQAVLKRCRTRNLPEQVDNDFIRLAGVPEVVLGRVAGTLRFLGLTDEDGQPTDILRSLAAAPEEQYREILAGAIRNAYEADFARIDPARDTQKQIIDAFRPYQPRSQTTRMVMLFLGLCREAGIQVKEAPRERAMGSTVPRSARSQPSPGSTGRPQKRKNQPGQADNSGNGDGAIHASAPNLLFTVTDEDVSVLTDAEFDAVWSALGKVARARAMARTSPKPQDSAESDSDTEEGDS